MMVIIIEMMITMLLILNLLYNHSKFDFFYFILFSCFICSLLLQLGYTSIIWASRNYELDIVCALLKFQANANAKNNVRNQLIRIDMMMSNDDQDRNDDDHDMIISHYLHYIILIIVYITIITHLLIVLYMMLYIHHTVLVFVCMLIGLYMMEDALVTFKNRPSS
jgi:hypothetical protein